MTEWKREMEWSITDLFSGGIWLAKKHTSMCERVAEGTRFQITGRATVRLGGDYRDGEVQIL